MWSATTAEAALRHPSVPNTASQQVSIDKHPAASSPVSDNLGDTSVQGLKVSPRVCPGNIPSAGNAVMVIHS